MTTTVSESNDLVSLFADDHNRTPRFATRHDNAQPARLEAMSPSSTEVSDDSSLTNDDLVVLSNLFGFANSGANGSGKPKRKTPVRTRTSRKRPRQSKTVSEDGSALPKSQQQRQKLEIADLKKQVVELQATIEDLQARKLERERQALEKSQQYGDCDNSAALNEWVGAAKNQVAAVQQLEEQNEKLRSQVATHLGQLKQLEHIARNRYLANTIPEPMQLEHFTSHYYSASC
ncbi:hypothetical protein PHMEG_00013245 [Phytophthora megakarya]|uniref:Uncharacterized protein n=1 Tax=Phytophthora megakarya TaxID=4795 RepID=A0A225W6Q1_9STRA|nr:hypothetical protein PHMEG_00013245 [Phytophthora megakarya]